MRPVKHAVASCPMGQHKEHEGEPAVLWDRLLSSLDPGHPGGGLRRKQCATVTGLWDSTQGICERQPSYGVDCVPSIMPGNPLGSLRFVQHDIQEDCTQPSHHYRLPAY